MEHQERPRAKPNLVIMDLAMPEMNGLEAATVLKNALPGVP
jgi:CheY-like chemotaxis protein